MIKLPDIELVSAKVHEAWMEMKTLNGIYSHTLKGSSGEELMVPYDQLSDYAKELLTPSDYGGWANGCAGTVVNSHPLHSRQFRNVG